MTCSCEKVSRDFLVPGYHRMLGDRQLGWQLYCPPWRLLI